ncbi:MAG TPA: site-2 protease family protein [Actinomycetota bacterium]|nr:site-2 protease family protein [Actinomycetota bacterium]
MRNVLNTVYFAIGLLIALDLHEYAHAFVAVRLGDQTPRTMGRLTLNPRPLVDPFGTLVLPGILLLPVLLANTVYAPIFAYAKPMPLNPWNLRRKGADAVWVALAGIGANVALAFAFGALLRVSHTGELTRFLVACLQVNVVMAAIQIVPIPGLDGGRFVARFLSPRPQEVFVGLEQYLSLFLLAAFFLLRGPLLSFVGVVGNGICRLAAGGPCL